jgi:hypothetical protein
MTLEGLSPSVSLEGHWNDTLQLHARPRVAGGRAECVHIIRDIFGTRDIKWCWRSELLVRMCGACHSASARLACTRGPHGNTRRGEDENAIHSKYVVGRAEHSPVGRSCTTCDPVCVCALMQMAGGDIPRYSCVG